MEHLNRKAQKDIPDLRRWVNSLLTLANKMTKNVKYSERDNFAFMALCFLSKQVDHMMSILALNQSRDVGLIARSMLEGMCQLLWAAKDPEPRALRWRTFAWVHDWRIMQGQITAGETVDATLRTSIEEALRQHGNQFLTRKARKARDRGDPLPNRPYHDNWTGVSVKKIFHEVKGEVLYQKLYGPFSDWHHWSPGGLGAAIARQTNHVFYSQVSLEDSATALATGFQCLLQTIEVLDKHMQMGMAASIAKLKDGYIAWGKAQGHCSNRKDS